MNNSFLDHFPAAFVSDVFIKNAILRLAPQDAGLRGEFSEFSVYSISPDGKKKKTKKFSLLPHCA